MVFDSQTYSTVEAGQPVAATSLLDGLTGPASKLSFCRIFAPEGVLRMADAEPTNDVASGTQYAVPILEPPRSRWRR
jgi:hypothetical protein